MEAARILCFALFLSPLVILGGSGQALPRPQPVAFPALPQPGGLPMSLQSSSPEEASRAGLAPAENPSQFPVLAPAPWGTGTAADPIQGPGPAMAPRSPYDPIFNPIISKATPDAASSTSYTNMQTVNVNSNGQVTTYNSNTNGAGGSYNNYDSTGYGPSTDGTNYGQQQQQQQQQQQPQQQGQQQQEQQQQGTYSPYVSAYGQQGNNNVQQSNNGYQNQLPVVDAPTPSPSQIAGVNPMVKAVELAHQQAQSTPQFSFGQDGLTVQQPVVTNPQDGVTAGGNQFKVNEYGVILGNVGTGGSVQMSNNGGVTIDPGTAGNLWNLARQAASLYGRKMRM